MNHDHHETESQATKMDDSQEAHFSSGHVCFVLFNFLDKYSLYIIYRRSAQVARQKFIQKNINCKSQTIWPKLGTYTSQIEIPYWIIYFFWLYYFSNELLFQASAFTSHLGQTLLFSAWEIKDEKHLAIACVAVAVVAVINEGLKAARQKLTHKTKPGQFLNKTYAQKLFNRWHIINTLLSLLQVRFKTRHFFFILHLRTSCHMRSCSRLWHFKLGFAFLFF